MKKFNLSVILIMISFIFSGCEKSGNPSSLLSEGNDDKKVVELSVVTSYGGNDGNRQNYEKAVKAYEAASGNTIKDSSGISNEEWKAQVMASFDNNSEPDILFYFTGADSTKIIESNRVVSIEEIRAVYPDYASNMDDEMLPKSPADGKSYAVPVNGYWEGLFVNKKILAECGVDVPGADTTWDQFLADCQKILEKGYVPIAASLNEVPHYWFEFCIFNNGSVATHPTLPKSSSDEAGKRWSSGLNEIKELYSRGFFPENTAEMSSVEADALMTDNKAAFMIDGSWKMGWFAENAADINNFTVTYIPGKGERKSTDIIGGISMGYFITRKAWENLEKQAACVEFIKSMTTDAVVATFGITAVTALKKDVIPPSDASNLVKDALSMTSNFTGISPATADGLPPVSRSDLFANVANIISGNLSAGEAVDHCLTLK